MAPMVLALALGLAAPAGATTLLELSVPEMTQRSELVFVGRVVGQTSRLDRSAEGVRVLTDTTFAVDRVLKGEKVRDFTLTQIGGTAGEGVERRTQVVHAQAAFAVGESVVLFLERTATGRLVPTGMEQGKYALSADDPPLAVRQSYKPRAAKLQEARVKTFAGAPLNGDRVTLPQLEAIVRGEKPVPAPVRVIRTPQVSLPKPEVQR
jgi:hypothetical protein